jgi:hypothetical protein
MQHVSWTRLMMLGLVFATAVGLPGCAATPSAFAQRADEAGETLAAAAATLDYARHGKLTAAYARASYVGYREQLRGLPGELSTLDGAPDQALVAQLVALFNAAQPALRDPCLSDDCDGRAQLVALQQASQG